MLFRKEKIEPFIWLYTSKEMDRQFIKSAELVLQWYILWKVFLEKNTTYYVFLNVEVGFFQS